MLFAFAALLALLVTCGLPAAAAPVASITAGFLLLHLEILWHTAAAAGRKGSITEAIEFHSLPTVEAGQLDGGVRDEFEEEPRGAVGGDWRAAPCAPLIPICLGGAREPSAARPLEALMASGGVAIAVAVVSAGVLFLMLHKIWPVGLPTPVARPLRGGPE